jgi:1,3-beta-glucan synthase
LVVFLALIVGPIVAGKQIKLKINLPMELLQPTGYSNNDTSDQVTGSCIAAVCPPYRGGEATGGGDAESTAEATEEAARRFRRYMAY